MLKLLKIDNDTDSCMASFERINTSNQKGLNLDWIEESRQDLFKLNSGVLTRCDSKNEKKAKKRSNERRFHTCNSQKMATVRDLLTTKLLSSRVLLLLIYINIYIKKNSLYRVTPVFQGHLGYATLTSRCRIRSSKLKVARLIGQKRTENKYRIFLSHLKLTFNITGRQNEK